MRTRECVSALVLAGLWLCFAAPLHAQRDLGTILGTVTDPSGGIIPGAAVTLTEDATGLTYEIQTDAVGGYIRPALKPGVYSVQVASPSFKTLVQRNVLLSTGDRIEVNLTLEIGEVTESIEVSGAPPSLQSESTIIGQTIQSRTVSELPLGGQRRFAFLAQLSPAVVPAEPGARDALGGGFAANGVRSNGQNNFLLNGVDNNVNVIDFLNGTAYVIGPAVEAISEMKVMTNGYNAEYGRGAGGVVNVTLKSGTNGFHGIVHWSLQHDKLAANRWERNKNGIERGSFKQNQFGANIGGPIIKDKLFFFANYQGIRIRSSSDVKNFTIPWPDFTQGDFSRLLTGTNLGTDAAGNPVFQGAIYDATTTYKVNGQRVREPFQGNIIPQSRWDSAATDVMAMFPAPNQNLNDRMPRNNYVAPLNQSEDINQGDLRLDYRLTDNDMLFGSMSWHEEERHTMPLLPELLDGTGFEAETHVSKPRNAMVSWTRVWSPTILTETRIAFTRLITRRLQANSDVDGYGAVGIGGLNPSDLSELNGGLPWMSMQRYTGVGGLSWWPSEEYSNVWDVIFNMSITKSSHALKWGFEYRPIDFPFYQVPAANGSWNFRSEYTAAQGFTGQTGDGAATFLLGMPGSRTQLSTSNIISSQRETYSVYFQDDWKVSPKLTINLGVRYDVFSPTSERFGRQSNFAYWRESPTLVIPEGPNQEAPLPPNFAGTYPQVAVERGVASKYLIPWDRDNFAPRIGFAYQFTPETVIRAGYGIFYGGEENEGGAPNRGLSVPFNHDVYFFAPNNLDANLFISSLSDGFPVNAFELPAPIGFRSTAKRRETPLVHKWNAAVQRELSWNMVWEISYVGSHGQHLTLLWNPNASVNDPRAPNLNPNPRRIYTQVVPNLRGFYEAANFGVSNYHGLATKLEKRFSNGLDFLMSYTWSHGLTDSPTPLYGYYVNARDNRNLKEAYSNAGFDVRHRFVTSFLYELPFGQGRRIGSGWSRALDAFLGGWQVNGILTMQTGFPISATTDVASGSFSKTFPDLVSGRDPNDAPPAGRSPEEWWDTGALANPTMGTWGSLGYMALRRPGMNNLDFSLFKSLSISESVRLIYRAEFINAFNTPHFGTPGTVHGQDGFGRINDTKGDPRMIQMSLRLEF
jgi:carboxypeptidase family protein/TonB-dependent receptor-like protein